MNKEHVDSILAQICEDVNYLQKFLTPAAQRSMIAKRAIEHIMANATELADSIELEDE